MTYKKKTKKQEEMTEDFNYEDFESAAIEHLNQGKPLLGEEGIMTPLIKRFVEKALSKEIAHHISNSEESNRRNGYIEKQLKTSLGEVNIKSPRDRNSSFEPVIVGKRQKVLTEEIDLKVISMYGLGLSYSGIQKHLKEIYGLSVSEGTLTEITNSIIEDVRQWQTRILEAVYPVLFMDAIHFKVKQGNKIISKAVYCVIGINTTGHKELLGMYLGESEGAKYWLGVLTDLKERGVEDVFIACIDNLSGFAEAIEAAFPKTDVQLCVIHQIRNSTKYVVKDDMKAFCKDMKAIYTAPNKDASKQALESFIQTWEEKYKYAVKSWERNWDRLICFYQYPPEIRKLIYTTNIIENFNGVLRKVTKTKRVFSSDMGLMKLLYLVQKRFTDENWTKPIARWRSISAQLSIIFEDRFVGK